MSRGNAEGPLRGLLFVLERVMGIEPTLFAWEARVLPLNDTRDAAIVRCLHRLLRRKDSLTRDDFGGRVRAYPVDALHGMTYLEALCATEVFSP